MYAPLAALRSTVVNALDKAESMGVTSISIPAISTGKFGFPRPLCARIMVDAVACWFEQRKGSKLKQVGPSLLKILIKFQT